MNWRKVAIRIGFPALLASAASVAWFFWPRVPFSPQKIGTILDHATLANSGIFNRGSRSDHALLFLTENEIWDISTRQSVRQGPLPASFFSPDGRLVFDGTNLYDWRSNRHTTLESPVPQFVSFNGGSGFQNRYRWAGFSNISGLVAASRPNGSLYLLNATTGKVIHALREGGSSISSGDGKTTCFVSSLAFTGDDKVLASGESNGNVSLWNTNTGDLIATLSDRDRPPCDGSAPQAADQIFSVGFSPNGQLLASQDQFGIVRIWDVPSRRLLHSLPLNLPAGSKAVGFNSDGRFLVASGGFWENGKLNGTWLVLDGASGRLLGAFSSPGQVSVGFLPDGNFVTAQIHDGRVKVEKWALRSHFRIPLFSSGPMPVELSDSSLLLAYEEQVVQTLGYLHGRLAAYVGGIGKGSFPGNLRDATGEQGFLERTGGYQFAYNPGQADPQGHIKTYTLSVRPLLYQQTGKRSFSLDQTGELRATEEPREATLTDTVVRSLQDLTQVGTATQSQGVAQNVSTAASASTDESQGPDSPQIQRQPQVSAPVNQWLSRAEGQFGQGDYRDALQSCDAALRLDPANQKAKQLRAKVESTMKILGKQ